MPILGTIASSYAQATTSFIAIETKTISGSSATAVEFTSIPNTYAVLQIRFIAKTTNSGDTGASAMRIEFNNDTTASNYYTVYQASVRNTGGTTLTQGHANGPNYGAWCPNSGSVSSTGFGFGILEIPDYTKTNKFKTTLSQAGYADTNNQRYYQGGVTWRSTSAITSLKLTAYDGNIEIGSSFALYGMKGS